MIKKSILIVISATIIVFVITFFISNKKSVGHPSTTQSVNLQNWNENIYNRKFMVDDLLEKNILLGNTQQEVISMLGKEGLIINTKDSMRYIIGRGYIDDKTLDLIFDEYGQVVKVLIGQT